MEIISRKLITTAAVFAMFAAALTTVPAQITVKLPNIKVVKPDKDKTKDTTTTTNTDGQIKNNKPDSKQLYQNQRPNGAPVLLKNSIYVQAKIHDEYWKMPNQKNYSSWVPLIRFSQFYNNEKELNYTVEYYNPDGSAWYSEKLESSGRNADRTVLYQSPSPYAGVLDTKSTNGTGVYPFKIINQDTKEILYQGKFKVGKFSRAYSPQEKNKFDFFVEHDWLLPFGMIGFHHSDIEIGGVPPLVSVWLKGDVGASELEGRVFYQGRQIASTKDGDGASGVSDYDNRSSEYAAAFVPNNIWKRWEFSWGNFRVDNNGGFNRDYYPKAHYADKNPGEYTVKIYRGGTQIREMIFTVGADGKFVAPAYTNQIPLPYHRIILPVKIIGTTEKWDAAAWKTDSFYGNPLSGFTVQ